MLRLSLRPNVVAAYLSALMVCAMGWLVYQRTDGARSVTAQSRNALAVMDAVRALDGRMRDANLAERDLVVTNDPRYAGAYTAASDGTVRALSALRDVSAPYPSIASRLDSLGYFVRLRLGELDETVRLRRDAGAGAAADVLRSQRSNESDRKIDELLGSIATTVDRSVSGTAAGLTAEGRLILLLIAATAVLAVLLAFFVNIMHARNVRAQRRMTEELENQSVQLQLQANELTATNRELENATTEMLRQTVEAERSEMRLAGILGSATDAVVSFDDDERIVYFNAAARRLFGLDEHLIPGARIRTAIAERSSLAFEEHMLAARRSAHLGEASPEVWDTLVVRPSEDEIPVEVSMA